MRPQGRGRTKRYRWKRAKQHRPPAAGLTTVEDDDGDDDRNTLALHGFMSPVVGDASLEVLTVVVKETEIEAPLAPTLCIRGGGHSSKRDDDMGS